MSLQQSPLHDQRDTQGAPGGSSPFAAAGSSVTTAGSPIPPLLASAVDLGRQAVQQAASPLRVEAATGAASLSIPIYVSPGRDPSTAPGLELTYSSHAGNGPFGLGWSLAMPSISRKTSRAVPRYSDQDVFVLSGTEDLVRLEGSAATNAAGYLVQRYGPRVLVGPSQACIERWINASDPSEDFWRTVSATGLTTLYGKCLDDRISDPEDPRRTFRWLVSATYDLKGNCCRYRYKAEDSTNLDLSCPHEQNRSAVGRTAGKYLKSIHYGNREPNRDLDTWAVGPVPVDEGEYLFHVVLDYGEHSQESPQPREDIPWPARADPFSSAAGGFEVRAYRLCRRVLVFHNFIEQDVRDCLVSSTGFTYHEAPTGSTLVAITRHGHRRVPDNGSGYRYTDETLPPLRMEYIQPALQPGSSPEDGDRLQPVAVDTSQFPDLPRTHTQQRTQWLDLDGEGSPGLLAQLAGGEWVYMRNESSGESPAAFSPPRRLQNVPSSLLNPGGFFAYLAGDGSLEFIDCDRNTSRLQGYSKRDTMEDSGWSPWVLMPTVPTDLDDRGWDPYYSIDLASSGRQDRVQFMQDSSGLLRWYPSLGTGGFASARTCPGPQIPRDEMGTTAILLADMTGDGLTDVVHVRSGGIVYWPNLGHGQFGARVRMDHAPILGSYSECNLSRVRLMDVDGSGCADLVYITPGGGASIYFNQCGNGWSEAVSLPMVPDLGLLASIELVDILGRGLPCLCWTLSQTAGAGPPRLYYLELMGEMKPRLLSGYTSGAGAQVSLHYRPSTHYYLQDEAMSQSWNTRLPFPVMCVATQTTRDPVAETEQITRYTYHDGFYDRTEREFRGFGLVDICQIESLSAGPGLKRLEVPPRQSRTWFHTGAPVSALGTSFGSGDSRVPQLVPFHLPEGVVSPSEARESLRALRGQILRTETYQGEKLSEGQTPLVVTQRSYAIVMEQAITGSENATSPDPDTVVYEEPHGRFRVLDRESLRVSYEANDDLEDARMEHQMYLETNEYGQCTKQVTIQYGRLNPPRDLDEETAAVQQETIIHYTASHLTNAIDGGDFFALPTAAEEKRYRMRGLSQPDLPSLLFSFETFADNDCDLLTGAIERPYEQDPGPAVSPEIYKVLISNTRSYYRDSGLTGRLALGQIEAYSVPDRTYQLAVTPGLVRQVFGANADEASLHAGWSAQDGAYADLDDDGSWWVPSPQSRFCSPAVAAQNAGTELREARSHFYLPRFTVDPYGNVDEEEVDRYCLLRVRSTDSVGNTESYQPDYANLQPAILTNSNQNRILIAYDGLGAAIGAAVQGKVSQGFGDTLDNFSRCVSSEEIASFYRDPARAAPELLGSASWRRIYNREWTSEMPVFEAEIYRDQHISSPSPCQISISISYLDGRGRKIQSVTLHSSGPTVQWRREAWSICSTMAESSVLTYVPSLESSHCFSKRSDLAPDNLPPSSVTVYDALNRAAATLHPDHTWQVSTLGAWTVKQRDAGDNVLVPDMAADEEVGALVAPAMDRDRYLPTWYSTHSAPTASAQDQAAAEKSKAYSNTPDLHHVDAAGRTISWVTSDGSPVRRTSRLHLDVAGNAAAAFDTLGRAVTRSQRDLCGRTLSEAGMDGGPTWSCPDAIGRPWLTWTVQPDDDKSMNRMRMGYDGIGRLTDVWLREGLPGDTPERLIVQHQYGDMESDAVERNLRGRHYRTWDQAGLSESTVYDFKGNCVSRETTYAQDYKGILDWSLTGPDRPTLEEASHAEQTEYNARNRAVRVMGVDGSITENAYDISGFLQTVRLTRGCSPETTQTYLEGVRYNALGQRELVTYGNGVQTRHAYDPWTQRQVHGKTWAASGTVLRDLQYTHDCAGRQVYREDAAQQDTYFRNSIVRPVNDYTYDARGQLVRATGREQIDCQRSCLTPYGPGFDGQQTIPGDGRQICQYTETLQYDAVGNISSLAHDSGDSRISGWKRLYFYEEASCLADPRSGVQSNRLSRTTVRGAQENYAYNGQGCTTSMPGTVEALWDHLQQLRVSTSQRVREGTPETTWYVYNALGARVRKVTERAAGKAADATKLRETYILSSLSGYEIYREYSGQGAVTSEKTTVQVSGGDPTPLALLEDAVTGVQGSAGVAQSLYLIRYQLDDGQEVDDLGRVVSLEEYSPFGSTTFRATRRDVHAPAKYRFSGYPRDTQETGLYHCGTRYYASWIGRWTSPDPLGVLAGLNVYCYVGNDPVNKVDPQGAMEQEPQRHPDPAAGGGGWARTTSAGIQRHEYRLENRRLHVFGTVLEVERPLTTGEIRTLAEMGHAEMTQRAAQDGLGEYTPTVMTAFTVRGTNTVILASSMKSVDAGVNAKKWTYDTSRPAFLLGEKSVHLNDLIGSLPYTTDRKRVTTFDPETRTKTVSLAPPHKKDDAHRHHFGGCGEIMALNQWAQLEQRPPDLTPRGYMLAIERNGQGELVVKPPCTPTENPGNRASHGCEGVLEVLGVDTSEPNRSLGPLPRSRHLRWGTG